MAYNLGAGLTALAGFGNGFLQGEEQMLARKRYQDQLAEQYRQAAIKNSLQRLGIETTAATAQRGQDLTAQNNELNRQQKSDFETRRIDEWERNFKANQDNRTNDIGLRAVGAATDIIKNYGHQPEVVEGLTRGLRATLPAGTALPGDQLDAGGMDVYQENPDGTRTLLDAAQPRTVPNYQPTPKEQAEVEGLRARNLQTQTETNLLQPRFDFQKEQARIQNGQAERRIGLTASGQQIQREGQRQAQSRFEQSQANTDRRQQEGFAHADRVRHENNAQANANKTEAQIHQTRRDIQARIDGFQAKRDAAWNTANIARDRMNAAKASNNQSDYDEAKTAYEQAKREGDFYDDQIRGEKAHPEYSQPRDTSTGRYTKPNANTPRRNPFQSKASGEGKTLQSSSGKTYKIQ